MHIDYWIFLLVCISVYIYSIFEVLHVLLKPKQYKDHPLVFKFCQVDVALRNYDNFINYIKLFWQIWR